MHGRPSAAAHLSPVGRESDRRACLHKLGLGEPKQVCVLVPHGDPKPQRAGPRRRQFTACSLRQSRTGRNICPARASASGSGSQQVLSRRGNRAAQGGRAAQQPGWGGGTEAWARGEALGRLSGRERPWSVRGAASQKASAEVAHRTQQTHAHKGAPAAATAARTPNKPPRSLTPATQSGAGRRRRHGSPPLGAAKARSSSSSRRQVAASSRLLPSRPSLLERARRRLPPPAEPLDMLSRSAAAASRAAARSGDASSAAGLGRLADAGVVTAGAWQQLASRSASAAASTASATAQASSSQSTGDASSRWALASITAVRCRLAGTCPTAGAHGASRAVRFQRAATSLRASGGPHSAASVGHQAERPAGGRVQEPRATGQGAPLRLSSPAQLWLCASPRRASARAGRAARGTGGPLAGAAFVGLRRVLAPVAAEPQGRTATGAG